MRFITALALFVAVAYANQAEATVIPELSKHTKTNTHKKDAVHHSKKKAPEKQVTEEKKKHLIEKAAERRETRKEKRAEKKAERKDKRKHLI